MKTKDKFRLLILHPIRGMKVVKLKLQSHNRGVFDSILIDSYLILAKTELKSKNKDESPEKVIWVVPPIGKGGGGATTISRFVKYFHNLGIPQEIHVYSDSVVDLDTQKSIWNFLGVSLNVEVQLFKDNQTSNIVIATSWQTYVPTIQIAFPDRRIVFLQDDERNFEISGDVSNLITLALPRFDFVIAAGSWLGETLTTPNQNVVSFYFGADQIYFPPLRYEKRHLIVFHQPEKPRRMPNLVSAFLTEFHQKYPEWKITVVGSTLRDINLKFANQVGVLEPTQLAEIYRRGTFGLVLSATNASLIPLEMLSAGLPVITNSGPNSQWLGSYSGLFYSRPTVESLIDTFEGSVKEKSPITEKVPDWDAQLDEFWSKFRNGLTKGVIKSFFLEKSTSKSKT